MAVRLAADLRPSADGSTVADLWRPAVAKLQAASVPIAWAAAPRRHQRCADCLGWNRQTDRQTRYVRSALYNDAA